MSMKRYPAHKYIHQSTQCTPLVSGKIVNDRTFLKSRAPRLCVCHSFIFHKDVESAANIALLVF